MTEKFRRRALIALLCFFSIVFGFEMFCRNILGLGDPALSIEHPTIEYMFMPSSEFRPFGNRFSTNAYGMRASDFSLERESKEVRILVLGDSIPNGGNLTDQSELATELLKGKVGEVLNVPVVVGNISAGSWSPPNLLAYIQEYGSFDAEVSVIILNKGDLYDFPSFRPLDPRTHPQESPRFASQELIQRYLFPVIKRTFYFRERLTIKNSLPIERQDCLGQLEELICLLRSNGSEVYLIYHPSENEFDKNGVFYPDASFKKIQLFSVSRDIRLFNIAHLYEGSFESGISPFRDNEHPNEYGQSLMAEMIFEVFKKQGYLNLWKRL